MSRSQLVPEFVNVAFALNDPKKVSNVVESEYGFHIIQLIERCGDMAPSGISYLNHVCHRNRSIRHWCVLIRSATGLWKKSPS